MVMKDFVFELVEVRDDEECVLREGKLRVFTQNEAQRIIDRMKIRLRAASEPEPESVPKPEPSVA